MTFSLRESSRSKGRPLSLYFFRYGDTPEAYIGYTDAAYDVTLDFDEEIGPATFKSAPIRRSNISVSGSLDKAALQIKTPQNSELADLFILHPPSQVVTLTIWDGHVGDDDFAVVWSGRVISHASEVNEAVYNCEPVSTSLKRAGLTRNYQIPCPLVLYSQGWGKCNASEEAATRLTHAISVDGPLVALPDNWAPADLKPSFATGFATWRQLDGRTERRTIIRLRDGNNTMVLSGLASGLAPALALYVTLGCPHTTAACKDLHNNIQNYGGQFLIPTENPFGVKNNFN